MKAISPVSKDANAERTQRHIRMCAELAELGTRLARATGARALATPGQHTVESAKATLLFTRMVETVCDCIAMEISLTADAPAEAAAAAPADAQREAVLSEGLRLLSELQPKDDTRMH